MAATCEYIFTLSKHVFMHINKKQLPVLSNTPMEYHTSQGCLSLFELILSCSYIAQGLSFVSMQMVDKDCIDSITCYDCAVVAV